MLAAPWITRLVNMNATLNQARFYGILDASYVPRERWLEKCQALIAGGADLVQVRAKNVSDAERASLVESVLPLFRGREQNLIVNDDVALAARLEGVGLHLGQDDTPVAEAREAIGLGRILGLSTHSLEQAKAAIVQERLLDYFAVGPVFSTPTKPHYQAVGLELARSVAALNPPLPFFCIGGIKRGNAPKVKAAGVQRVVVVSDVLLADDTAAAVREIRSVFTDV